MRARKAGGLDGTLQGRPSRYLYAEKKIEVERRQTGRCGLARSEMMKALRPFVGCVWLRWMTPNDSSSWASKAECGGTVKCTDSRGRSDL